MAITEQLDKIFMVGSSNGPHLISEFYFSFSHHFLQYLVDPLKIEEIYGHLLAYEQCMEINQPSVDISIGSANFATKRGFPRGGRGGRFHYSHSSRRGFPTNTSYGRNFRGRGRGRGPLNSFNTTKPICQICRKPGHEDSDCYRRFDNSSPHDSIALMQPQAHYASQQAPLDQAWYSDSGATHHLTPDLTNLTINAADYIGSDQIRMGNGNGLAIEHIRDTQLTSPTTSFLLRNVLHVPLITKNLLSFHKFTLETNTYIEFHPWFFLVNEQGLGKILLQRLNDGGLYKLPPSISPNSFLPAVVCRLLHIPAEICIVIKSIHPMHPQLWLENARLLVLGTHALATQLYISVLKSYPSLNYLY
jgi:hypothetical protein